jgi:hypothetical protein
MKNILLITCTLFIISCENSGQPLLDQTSSVFGSVKSEEGNIIDSCIIGFLNPIIDTTLIENDSVLVQHLETRNVSIDGSYRIDWFLGPVPLPYGRMYAFKDGYKRWQFSYSRDKIINVDIYVDSVNIVLIK